MKAAGAPRALASKGGAARSAPVPTREGQGPAKVWQMPSVQDIAFTESPLSVQVTLDHGDEDYVGEGKPQKVCLGPYAKPEDWDRFRPVCPAILRATEQVLQSFDHKVEVTFGDVLDYAPGHLLGWHQDNMDLKRHVFTVVLTLVSCGEGRTEWRRIAPDGRELLEVVSSTRPGNGSLAIHGLCCNNALAHRAFWDEGRRIAVVLFCRSAELEAALQEEGTQSRLSMRHWWTKAKEAQAEAKAYEAPEAILPTIDWSTRQLVPFLRTFVPLPSVDHPAAQAWRQARTGAQGPF
ncbi:unnamed protein product [Effrenium voratum]|uniref:Uncharacterized protein n=1 Tax=Effrenium voratum TaxID=2562239 RepID=A0AA36NJ65_9DINO|nr:unnamed protein product [Effrenium voratum]